MQKVFVIGFNKCGTRSIHRLFLDSGFRSVHWDSGKLARKMLDNVLKGRRVFSGYEKNTDVFSDMNFRSGSFWFEGNSLFRQMAVQYPRAQFIYNTRPMEDWLRSRANHLSKTEGEPMIEFQQRIYGYSSAAQVIQHWKSQRELFETDVIEYFSTKTDRLLWLDISDGKVAEKISTFVGERLDPGAWSKWNESTG